MTYQNDNYTDAVAQIQELLRNIQIANGGTVTQHVDGIYDKTTEDSVRNFQSENNLQVTGTVDKETYDKLYQTALEADFKMSLPIPIYPFGNGKSVKKGEKSDFVMLLQLMLNALTIAYDSYSVLEINGLFDDATESAIKSFQTINKIMPSGIVDKETWNALAESYNQYVDSE